MVELDRRGPPFAEGAKDGAPSSTWVGSIMIEKKEAEGEAQDAEIVRGLRAVEESGFVGGGATVKAAASRRTPNLASQEARLESKRDPSTAWPDAPRNGTKKKHRATSLGMTNSHNAEREAVRLPPVGGRPKGESRKDHRKEKPKNRP